MFTIQGYQKVDEDRITLAAKNAQKLVKMLEGILELLQGGGLTEKKTMRVGILFIRGIYVKFILFFVIL